MHVSPSSVDRYEGCLLGLAVGDAVGMQVEFAAPGSFEPVADMGPGGPHDLPEGYWTDDTSLALCIADSLIDKRQFDAIDQMNRFLRWREEGYRSSTGECFDIGIQTSSSLTAFQRDGRAFRQTPVNAPSGASNGSLMRLAPVPMAFAANQQDAVLYSALSSATTHPATEAVDACSYFGLLLQKALSGSSKDELLRRGGVGITNDHAFDPQLTPNVLQVAIGSYLDAEPPVIAGSGHVVKAMEAALWAVHTTDDFRNAVLKAANLGDDADTTAAIAGQLAGAIYGVKGIPEQWVEKTLGSEEIKQIARGLLTLSQELQAT